MIKIMKYGEVDNKDIFARGTAATSVEDIVSGIIENVKANGDKYDEVVIANYMTSIEEGYVFTAQDVGKQAIIVAYGEYTVTYEITVTE